jgi:tetratricopeptide (TPR) repeat protein
MNTPDTTCSRCHGPLTDGRCPSCGRAPRFRLVHREIWLLVCLCGIAVVGFLLTRQAAASTRQMRLEDAGTWFASGAQALKAGDAEHAIEALRRASAIDRDNRGYRLALASALSAGQHVDETREVLLRLREGEPEDPEVNVQLAHLEAHAEHVPAAIRYYQSALYGRWNPDAFDDRRRLRIEMIRYLLAQHDQRRALSELLILSANLPDDAGWQTTAGALFMEAGDARRALDHYARVLAIDPKNPVALAGAGGAALTLGDYAVAQSYLRAAPADVDHVADSLRMATLVLTNDPLAPRLPLVQRRDRMHADLAHAVARLDRCTTPTTTPPAGASNGLEALRTVASGLEPALALDQLRESPDAIEAGVNLIYRIEQATATGCGQPDELDQALLRIGRQHNTDQP